MNFGEIVEPSTRALVDDEDVDPTSYQRPEILWEGNHSVPQRIETLIIIESRHILTTFSKHVLKNQKPLAELKNSQTQIYNLGNHKYLVLYKDQSTLTEGEIVVELKPWLDKSEKIFALTSMAISGYINDSIDIKPTSLIRNLSTDPNYSFSYAKLETPNLLTGLGATVLTYSIHSSLHCSLFVFYVDNLPLDSVNSGPLVALLHKLDIPLTKIQTKLTEPSHNLYM